MFSLCSEINTVNYLLFVSYVINIDVLFILIVALKQNDRFGLSVLICDKLILFTYYLLSVIQEINQVVRVYINLDMVLDPAHMVL